VPNGDEPSLWSCSVCGATFDTAAQREAHERIEHGGED
jgi:hypothetical protein